MAINVDKLKELTRDICPEQLSTLDKLEVLAFMESLQIEFGKLGLSKQFSAKGLYSGIDFCYRRPIVFWTRTGINFSKRYENELFADCYAIDDQIGFEAAAPLTDEDFEEMTDEELFNGGMIQKTWPQSSLIADPQRLLREVVSEFKAFYRPYRAIQNW